MATVRTLYASSDSQISLPQLEIYMRVLILKCYGHSSNLKCEFLLSNFMATVRTLYASSDSQISWPQLEP
jgi:hypothetical protein